MADSGTNTPAGGLTSPKPESPTTARPLDFDDDHDTGVSSTPAQQSPPKTEVPPPKPPRPLSPRQQAEETLKEAFPTVEAAVIRAVLTASDYNIERSFHALLGMTDPKAQAELPPPPPAKPPRPVTSTTRSQLEQDERLARQLAEHYNGPARHHHPQQGGYRSRQRYDDYEEEEREPNFFEDELPIIRENIRKGFLETQSKVNAWVQSLKKKLDGEETDEEDDDHYQRWRGDGRPRRSGESGRRSEPYDEDPRIISDNFAALELEDTTVPPRPPRPQGNPSSQSTSQERRKVAFQEGPPESINDTLDARGQPKRTPSGGKSSKWQPLSTVDPSPINDNDPFSLGDSEDERETKNKDSGTDEDRVKKATAEAMAEDLGSSAKK
ncbi:hypothetical protein VTN49DRAFT_1236 [Thermomyces lanuginosus]|uniref:uncharacterized protein n=1 Tax=Thermomyces lanuginosus TaxID=5541 RepID=UPI003742FC2D